MFEARRADVLNQCIWAPSPEHKFLGYIEVWWAADQNNDELLDSENYHYRQGFLADHEVDDWLHQRHQFSRPHYSSSPSESVLAGRLSCIRLLMCERLTQTFYPPIFAMSRESFERVESAFGLPRATLSIFCRNAGMEYSRLGFARQGHDNAIESLPTLSVVIKYPQMFQLGNLGFSMTHSLSTGNTLAFLHGWSIFRNQNAVTKRATTPHWERIHSLLRPSVTLWKHPLLLPTLLFQEHLFRCDEFIWQSLSRETQAIEFGLGMSRTGRLANTQHAVLEEIANLLSDDGRRLLITSDANTALTDAITFASVLNWDQRLGEFIRRLDKELQKYYERANIEPATVRELESAVDHFSFEAVSTAEYVASIRSRLEVQLSVLYNFVAQSGNNLNSRIAATAGLDSAAMKALALVTAIFLPPAYVASLFSMSMFDWQASDDGSSGHGVISNRFWIYLVVSVPLTAAILAGWRFWWKSQKVHYAKEYPRVLSSAVKE